MKPNDFPLRMVILAAALPLVPWIGHAVEGDTWVRKADMPTARLMLACAAVGGKIYAIGGDLNFVSSPLKIVEEYDPATDTWTRKADMPTARSGLAAAAVDDKIYVIGGLTTFGATLNADGRRPSCKRR
jgi:hypothetical protein